MKGVYGVSVSWPSVELGELFAPPALMRCQQEQQKFVFLRVFDSFLPPSLFCFLSKKMMEPRRAGAPLDPCRRPRWRVEIDKIGVAMIARSSAGEISSRQGCPDNKQPAGSGSTLRIHMRSGSVVGLINAFVFNTAALKNF